MSTNDTSRFDAIKATHERLSNDLREAYSSAKPFDGDQTKRAALLDEVDALLKDIESAAPTVRSLTEYNFLNNATAFWNLAFAKILEVPKSVPILSPPPTYDVILSDEMIKRYLDEEANKVSLTRRLDKAMVRIRNAVISDFVETTEPEKRDDWLAAEIYLGSDILFGSGELWRFVNASADDESTLWRYFTDSTFEWAGRVWLRDIIKLEAYMNWLRDHRTLLSDGETKSEYVKACRKITERVSRSDIKCNVPENMAQVVFFIKSSFLKKDSYEIDETNERCYDKIRRKANRIAELTKSSADKNDANWFRAIDFMKLFYQNICQSILNDNDVESRNRLIEAFSLSENPANNSPVVDCFEALLLIYYVSNLKLPDVWSQPS